MKCSINLSILSGMKCSINLSLHGVKAALQIPLASHLLVIDGLHLIDRVARIGKFNVKLTLGSICRIKQSTALFYFSRQGSSLALSNAHLLGNLLARACFILEGL